MSGEIRDHSIPTDSSNLKSILPTLGDTSDGLRGQFGDSYGDNLCLYGLVGRGGEKEIWKRESGRTDHSKLIPPFLCPCPSITAYWRPPPTWPRLLFCEVPCKLLQLLPCCGPIHRVNSTAILLVVGTTLLAYFVVMDIFLFDRFRSTSLAEDAGTASQAGELYSPFTHLSVTIKYFCLFSSPLPSPFTHLSVKAILSDHPRHYIFTPSTELFNSFTGFTDRLPFISADAVSFTHLLCAFISGKFVASENLSDRRIGVGIFFFRTWLDSLDGIVYRAHAGRHLQYNSGYSSIGYFVDGFVDTLGGYFLSFGVLFYLWKRFGVLPSCMSSSSSSPSLSPATSSREKNSHSVWIKSYSTPSYFKSSPYSSSTTNFLSPHDETEVVLLHTETDKHKVVHINSSNLSSMQIQSSQTVTGKCGQEVNYSRTFLFLKVFAYGVALLVAGGSWDRAVKMYSEVFQVQLTNSTLSMLQFELSHCTSTLAIFFLWRFISGQTLLTYMQLAIFMDRIWVRD
ncbi:ceramide phosphoethanolamine synthase [Plakobranchus ocellatus]|uniref:Ceramide phosphoethanolamine synthase n=1 Tax=Plakobranchus ocellatus TaxID=259542 RepID=A0AAV4DSW1_9GAST|nr:ceramide phosphoethanolamine synthase [Plakobranchus ocellatus]